MTPKCHILVIDGDGDVRDLIVDALQSAGYVVSTASGGREVLDQITLQPVHAVVLDVTASRDAGMKLDEQLEALRLPFVMMSESWEALEAADGTRPRMLRKSFRATDLYDAVEAAPGEVEHPGGELEDLVAGLGRGVVGHRRRAYPTCPRVAGAAGRGPGPRSRWPTAR